MLAFSVFVLSSGACFFVFLCLFFRLVPVFGCSCACSRACSRACSFVWCLFLGVLVLVLSAGACFSARFLLFLCRAVNSAAPFFAQLPVAGLALQAEPASLLRHPARSARLLRCQASWRLRQVLEVRVDQVVEPVVAVLLQGPVAEDHTELQRRDPNAFM